MQYIAGITRLPSTTPLLRDPRDLPLSQNNTGSLFFGPTEHDNSAGNAFWATLGKIGSYQTANPNTKRTIVNVASGQGHFRGAIGAVNGNPGDTTTWTITMDGSVYTIVHVQSVAQGRSIIGAITEYGEKFTTAQYSGGFSAHTEVAARADNRQTIYRQGPCQIRDPIHCTPIRFDQSLKVEIQLSNTAGGGNAPTFAGVIWNLTA